MADADAYNYIPSFFSSDPRAGALTYEQLDARRKIAAALASRSRPFPKTIGEGLTALGEGLGAYSSNRELERGEATQRERDAIASRLPSGIQTYAPPAAPTPIAPSATPAPVSAAPAPDAVKNLAQSQGTEIASAPILASATPSPAPSASPAPPAPQISTMPIEQWKQRVARIESGSVKDPYRALGPVSKRGDRGYGKYQVMGENVPIWTEQYLGRKMTPQEFLASDEAQERLAEAKGGEYINKYGPEGAAKAWFAGEKGMNDPRRKDTLGTHVAEYARRFNEPLVSRDQIAGAAVNGGGGASPVQYASLGGAPTSDAGPDIAPTPAPPREAVTNTLMAQQQPAQPMQPGIGPQTLGTLPPPPPMQQQPITPAPAAPSLPPSREPIPPAALEEMKPAGPEPVRPGLLGPSPAMQYWAQQINNPYLSPKAKEHAARMYATEDAYRKEMQTQKTEEYRDQREAWQRRALDKEKHDRETGRRIQEDLIRRLNIEKEQAAAANRPLEVAKLEAELQKAIRDLNKPDTASVAGTQFERPYAPPGSPQQPYAVPAGLPKPKEDMTETQAKATTFYLRVKPDLDKVDTQMKSGAALTSMKDAALDALGPLGSGNIAISDDYRRARDALGNWGAAFLTHVSGAAVSPSEALRNLPAFIPRPGDTPQDIADKAERRRAMMEAIQSGAGTVGMDKIKEFNDAYEFKKAGEKPPQPVQSPEEASSLPPGTRIVLPDGSPGRVPARSR